MSPFQFFFGRPSRYNFNPMVISEKSQFTVEDEKKTDGEECEVCQTTFDFAANRFIVLYSVMCMVVYISSKLEIKLISI